MTRPSSFRQADVERLLKAAMSVGIEHPTVDALPDGRLRLFTAPQAPEQPLSPFEAWERENGDRAA
jgi:hypothetical protein